MTNNPVAFPVETIRSLFPALHRNPPFIFLDNAAGAQIPQNVLDAVTRHLLECNVQRGGRYAKSQEVDATIARGRQSVADLLNAYDPNEDPQQGGSAYRHLVSGKPIEPDLAQRPKTVAESGPVT